MIRIHRTCRTSSACHRLLQVCLSKYHVRAVLSDPVEHCYAILNVSTTCTNDELRTAYLHLVKKFHPDSTSGHANAAKFAQVEDAYRRILVNTNVHSVCVCVCVGHSLVYVEVCLKNLAK